MNLKNKTPLAFITPPIILFFILYAIGFWNIPLPYVDLIAFSHVNSLSTIQLSQGHDYYVTQFSYILPHFLYRALCIWEIGVIGSSLIAYCIMFGLFFLFVQIFIENYDLSFFNKLTISLFIGILLQGLGLMVWGGPLFFSMGIAFSLISYSLICIKNHNQLNFFISFISGLFAVTCHPFMLPILCILFASNAMFVSKIQLVRMSVIIFVSAIVALTAGKDFSQFYGLKITLTSKEFLKFGFSDALQRIYQCVSFQTDTSIWLLGENIFIQYFISLFSGLVILSGVAVSIFKILNVFIKTKDYKNNHFKISFTTVCLYVYYLFSPDEPFGISMWPQRILICILPLATLSNLIPIIEYSYRKVKPNFFTTYTPLIVTLIVIYIYYNEMKFIGSEYKNDVFDLEKIIVDSDLKNTYLFFNQINIQPFWKRCVPFALFTSDKIRKENIYYISEWHLHPQHNVRSTYKLNNQPTIVLGIQKIKGNPWVLFKSN